MLCPITANRNVQVIDVRDLAVWIIRSGRDRLVGTIDAVGDRHSLADVLNTAAEIACHGGMRREPADEWVVTHGVEHWSGPRSLPLGLPAEASALMKRDNRAFHGAGGALRSLESTLTDTLADERQRGLDRDRKAGLAGVDELLLIRQLAAAT